MTPFLFVGLGNPGATYERTRHNAGFRVVDAIAQSHDCTDFSVEKNLHSEVSSCNIRGRKVFLVKPTTFMNLSGRAVQAVSAYYKIPLENVIVIHDELDLPFGEFKWSHDRGPAGHNGIKDIIEKFGTKEFLRLRIGVEGRTETERTQIAGSDYVLGRFSEEQETTLVDLLPKLVEELESKI